MLLDEPTNHLDIDARQALIEALNGYEGCVILVSHDPHLVEAVADRLYIVRDAGVGPYDDDLNGYRNLILDQRRRERSDAKKSKKDKKDKKANKKSGSPSHNSLNALEEKLNALSEQKLALEHEMATPNAMNKPAIIEDLLTQYAAMEKRVNEAETAWFEAQEQAG